ncbi:helix-turn-helix transcriptional regulator [Methylobacillus flagellatus]|uniref:helix-turn-helix transcriptional regulator n=1 Tax=Methylobacillus flagellatus TaxID=405 RepID=UPI0028540408|nr:helix-turn-helix transcriptional regulator [Methylobacillus flagellatus]MDR5172880.1 helix-turn-helix transcriptional regulator [Methylobacillus flagellatus]
MTSSVEAFSNVLLKLHDIAEYAPIDRYQELALDAVQEILPFDTAWWGIMSPNEVSFRLHGSHLHNLPDSFVPMWEELKYDDALAKAVEVKPAQTVYFDQPAFDEAPGLATLMGEHAVTQAFCTSHYLPSENAFVFLSLYREDGSPRFNVREGVINKHLMPHLCAFWESNRMRYSEKYKGKLQDESIYLAIVDRQYQIFDADNTFFDVLRQEWPKLNSLTLPKEMVAQMHRATPSAEIKFGRIIAHYEFIGDFCILAIRERQQIDLLTKRELMVAKAFSTGASYKDIARSANLSPTTVRYYLRVIYDKLNVNNKAEMATLIRSTSFSESQKIWMQSYRVIQKASQRSGRSTFNLIGTSI